MIEEKFVITDFDGVITSKSDTPGSYFTHGQDEYGPSKPCIERLIRLCRLSGAKVVISSNWRKFDPCGSCSFVDGSGETVTVQNPLPAFRKALGHLYFCDLPPIRHIPKSMVLASWLTNKFHGKPPKFVVFDDDPSERFAETSMYNINGSFILTDDETGLTDEDVGAAMDILERK